ncbi:hypothetical protein PICMEDRAFT_156389 [Pichia membranifaciens NRRL Y-2026]|uniref:Uncharacterized protein n=1 Tax=Pichia membranifaciens NRRL Y-2026 TaxID=763406 RepID=A0A1E3NFL1_9ASCO|nr:hypothetical protein PICMEDRAFT_156389 [Pichia membranifaciens NRRL Y-2026]ODQ44921.1 hypothetical protein PICMEDRAFT_156389 [Pichia membranifaciens NRRL Y-2026]
MGYANESSGGDLPGEGATKIGPRQTPNDDTKWSSGGCRRRISPGASPGFVPCLRVCWGCKNRTSWLRNRLEADRTAGAAEALAEKGHGADLAG